MALGDEGRRGSDDSSEEDEPIAASAPAAAGGVDDVSSAWMNADEEDEEEEDAEWSQLPAAVRIAERSPKFKRALAAVEKEPWDTDAWAALMGEVQQLPAAEARVHYEAFLARFPTSGRWWKLYAEHELREKNYDRVQEIIKKSLMQIRCLSVDLWRFYLTFTKVVQLDVAVDSKDAAAIRAARQLMADAFELALERVGASIHAAPIWQSYLAFLQDDPDPQAFLAVRKVFHRAVALPLVNMEALWREYEKFERSIPNNDALALSFFKVFRAKFDAARAVLRDRKKLQDVVNLNALAVPAAATRAELAQMAAWQKIIAFETGNPERLDPIRLKARMRFTLELFVSVKRHFPDAWYQYAVYESDANDRDAATAVFERAIEALPDSTYLHFALADHHELHGDVPAAKAIYERVIKDNVSALAYVAYQRFARRAYGAKGLAEARNVFKKARKDERDGACTYHVFAASALLEFHSDSSDAGKEIALKIFELGLKKCIQEPAYVLCYLDFLGHLNDDNNMRSLFEKALAVMPVEVSRPIWDRYVEFEHTMVANGGDLATVAKVEARRAQAFPDAPFVETKGLLSIAHRYSFLDLKPPSRSDQRFLDLYGASKRSTVGGTGDDLRELGGEQSGAIGMLPHVYTGPTVFPGLEGGLIDVDRQVPGPPLPDFLKEFASMLPLHLQWNGPIADVEHIYRAMLLAAKNGGDGDDGPGVSSKRPAHDVFRSRQKQKLAKLG
ncbi:hypothetical protein PybrP1_002404 [[Pythium] brassicae (nom. inval.)]|nr:hypothetical protein PybrP1_002404 [[Pythium] brassicae (nom. inval.)]